MELNKTYTPQDIEDKWYAVWVKNDFFSSKPNPEKQPYTIVIPPPNVTGILHMGHMLNNTIQDVLVRKARMEGKEACWVPGTDHAAIATEAKVVAKLKAEGIEKKDLTRDEFLENAWDWTKKYGGIILEQLKKLGASCDWQRTRFTLEEALSESVIKVFVRLYEKGLIYRGARMINWDPEGQTALSDEEVIYKETDSILYYLRYRAAEDANRWLTVATTRPETILGDVAVCVNPDDARYTDWVGKEVIVPIINRKVPVISDNYVDADYGTGCLKITPAHDLNDYEIGLRHKLPIIDVLADDGTMSEAATFCVGKDRFDARKIIAKKLETQNDLVKTEGIRNKIGFSERTNAVVEPKISTQWFLKMEKLAKPALENVLNDTIRFHPPKFKNTYRHWMENIRDWCLSRQLWWGHRIPAYYLPDGQFVVAENLPSALSKAQKIVPEITADQLRQDQDVLDTWFSSALWPITVFDGIRHPENPDFKYYYPTNDLVTAPEILFFWVARMIISGYAHEGKPPFRNVYLTGIVRDGQRRKMSKSLGNSPDALKLIETFGADAVRVGMLFSSPAGNDLKFEILTNPKTGENTYPLLAQGRNFANKIWNAFRLIKSWKTDPELPSSQNQTAILWFDNRCAEVLAQIEDCYEKYRISDALMHIYRLIWDDFCAWYLEIIKPAYPNPIDKATYQATLNFFEKLMKILHPFMPFITEEIWHQIKKRAEKECILVAKYPEKKPFDAEILKKAKKVFEIIGNIRNLRNAKQISPKEKLELHIRTANNKATYQEFTYIIEKLAHLSALKFVDQKDENAASFVLKGGDEFFVPLNKQIDKEKEQKTLEKELSYTKGFLKSVSKKLSNSRFVDNAPEAVVNKEKQKKADAESKIIALEAALKTIRQINPEKK